jgi:hypothetical protein
MARKQPPLASRALYILSESSIPLPTDQASRSRRINQRVGRNQFFRPSEKGLKASSLRNNPPYRSSTSSRPQLVFSLCRNLRKPANFNCGEASPEFALVQCCDWWGKVDLRVRRCKIGRRHRGILVGMMPWACFLNFSRGLPPAWEWEGEYMELCGVI